jgi:hypothetical protein
VNSKANTELGKGTIEIKDVLSMLLTPLLQWTKIGTLHIPFRSAVCLPEINGRYPIDNALLFRDDDAAWPALTQPDGDYVC